MLYVALFHAVDVTAQSAGPLSTVHSSPAPDVLNGAIVIHPRPGTGEVDWTCATIELNIISYNDKTHHELQDGHSPASVRYKIYKQGVILFEIPPTDIDPNRWQDLRIDIEPADGCRFIGSAVCPIGNGPVDLTTTINVSVVPVTARNVRLRLVRGRDKEPVPDEPVVVQVADGFSTSPVAHDGYQLTDYNGVLNFTLDDSATYKIWSWRMDARDGAFDERKLTPADLRHDLNLEIDVPSPTVWGNVSIKMDEQHQVPLADFGGDKHLGIVGPNSGGISALVEKGVFKGFLPLAPGTYNFELPEGLADYVVCDGEPFELRATGERHDVTIRKKESASLVLTITNSESHSPVANAQVTFLENGSPRSSDKTDANGVLSLPTWPEGDYDLKVNADGFAERASHIRLLQNTERSVDLQPLKGLKFQIDNFKDISGKLSIALLGVAPPALAQKEFEGKVDENGTAKIANLTPGTYDILLFDNRTIAAAQQLKIGGDAVVHLTHAAGIAISGRITSDLVGSAPNDLWFVRKGDRVPFGRTRPGAGGSYQMVLLPGTYLAFAYCGNAVHPAGEIVVDPKGNPSFELHVPKGTPSVTETEMTSPPEASQPSRAGP